MSFADTFQKKIFPSFSNHLGGGDALRFGHWIERPGASGL